MGGKYILVGSYLEKCGQFWENGRFSGRIWPNWGNTAWADMAGLGSIGLMEIVIVEEWSMIQRAHYFVQPLYHYNFISVVT